MTRKRSKDLSDAQLKASADRCNGCKGFDNPRICEAAKQQGACKVAAQLPPHFGEMRQREGAKVDAMTRDFMQFFESQGVKFVDGATGRKLSADIHPACPPRRSGIYTRPTGKHPRRKPGTPRSRVKSCLRMLWLRSRERAAAIKAQHNTCQRCGRKGSVAKGREVKTEVHHKNGIDWEGVVDIIIERILQDPSKLEVLCKDCHGKVEG